MTIKIKREGMQVFFTVDEKEYRTNTTGEGLWVWTQTSAYDLQRKEYIYEWRQLEGTCQFSLRQETRSGMRKAIKKYFTEA